MQTETQRTPLDHLLRNIRMGSIPVRRYGASEREVQVDDVPLADIKIARENGSLNSFDVVYTARCDLPSGITVRETRTGEADFDFLWIALGWNCGLSHNVQLVELTKH
jgi:hypothetical protein